MLQNKKGLGNLNIQTLAPSSEQLLAFLKSPFSSCKDVIIQSKIRKNKKSCKIFLTLLLYGGVYITPPYRKMAITP